MMNTNKSSSSSSSWNVVLLTTTAVASASVLVTWSYQRRLRSKRRQTNAKWHVEEEQAYGHDTLPSIIEHFKDFNLDKTSTVKEANQRRTLSYYLKARQSQEQSLVLGHANFDSLLKKRHAEMDSALSYWKQGTKSHRTVIIMLDQMTQHLMEEARHNILAPLQYSTDMTTRGVWIPDLNLIPPQDMHVTVAIPWWWHTMLPDPADNHALSQALAHRLRQALVVDFHHPFVLELERIILLGGKTLVALWRTVGERYLQDGPYILQDRHGTDLDPMVRLRREIVHCFTTENENYKRKPLTYHAHKQSLMDEQSTAALLQDVFAGTNDLGGDEKKQAEDTAGAADKQPQLQVPSLSSRRLLAATKQEENGATTAATDTQQQQPRHRSRGQRPPLTRQPTIEFKTPGMGDGDGFIHTTLCRLPLDCLSTKDVELEPIHRLCREATAMYAGHRMIVSKFRFLETTGKGGDSNPCVAPIFDETMDAPARVSIDSTTGQVTVVGLHHIAAAKQQQHAAAVAAAAANNSNGMNGSSSRSSSNSNHMVETLVAGEQEAPTGSPGLALAAAQHPALWMDEPRQHATIGALPAGLLQRTLSMNATPVSSLFEPPCSPPPLSLDDTS